MKALLLQKPGQASIETIAEPVVGPGELLLKVRMVGFCGSDLNSFRGLNPLVSFPRIPGHEVSATIMEGDGDLPAGTDVALSPYTSCGKCASCRRGRPNACQFNQTLGVQRDGALTEFIAMPREKLYPARLSRKELCLVEPLTVGFHAVARGRVAASDTVAVFGCGGVGLGVVAGSSTRGARTICVDVEDEKLQLALAAGGTHAINSTKEALHDRLLELTEGARSGCRDRSDRITSDIPRDSRRSRIHGPGGLYRICQGARAATRPGYSCKRNWTFWDRAMPWRRISTL